MPFTGTRRMKCKVDCAPRRFDERVATTREETHAMHFRLPEGVKGATPIGPPSGGNGTGATSWFGTSRADPRDMRRNEDGEYTRMGLKGPGGDWFKDGRQGQDACAEGIKQHGSGPEWFDKALDERRKEATKAGGDWFGPYAQQKANGTISPGRLHGSRSDSRKAASALIAEIPFTLAEWIARCFTPSA
jgi:hypothetical protein